MRTPENRERLHTDLEFSDYLKYPASAEEVRSGVESWMREAVIAPFSYVGVIEDGRFKAFGQDMVVMAEHGLQERVGQVGQKRAEADLLGIQRIASWLKEEAKNGDVVCLLSPPGPEEEGFGANGQRRLSFTQFGVVQIEGPKRQIRMVSIPEKEIDITSHVGRVVDIWGSVASEWLRTTKQTDKGLVSAPLFIPVQYVKDGLNRYVAKQGKVSWEEVETEIKNGLALKEDNKAEKRRKSLIDTITWSVLRYVGEKDSRRLNNIGLVARVVMAREATGKYLNWTPEEIIEEYDKIESAKWYQIQLSQRKLNPAVAAYAYDTPEAVVAYKILSRLQQQLRNEVDVQEMLMGSSCGGGGVGDLMDRNVGLNRIDGMGSYLDQLANRASGLQKNEAGSETTSKMECVKCPFCHKTVDAILTADKIKCPECKAEVSRS